MLAAARTVAPESSVADGMNEPQDEVEVVTYNVLSSELSKDSYYWHNSREDLDPPTRLKRVFKKLLPMMHRNAIICLQECSMLWVGEFHSFFQQRGYHFVASTYGWHFNGSMGVGIAFPIRRYEAKNVSIQRVSAMTHGISRNHKTSGGSNGDRLDALLDLAGYFTSPFFRVDAGAASNEGNEDEEQPETDVWEYSRARQNTMVALKLEPRQNVHRPFVVATYHMPCAYWSPQVMVIHTALAAQCAHKFANGHPLILAGDWNFKPGSAPYQLLTTARLPVTNPAHPGHIDGESWRIDSGLEAMKSAYAEKNSGGEPEFTNYAWVKDDTDPFIGTLDYIFVSQSTEVVSIGKLPALRSCRDPFPTSEEPSDHLMLSARLRPYGKQKREEVKKSKESKSGLSRPPRRLGGKSGRGFAKGFG